MTTPTNPIEPFSPFLPSTYNIPEEDDRLKEYLGSTFSDFSDVVNDKKIGAFTQDAENLNGEKWIYDTTKKVRNGYQAIARIKSFISETIPMPIGNINPQFVISHVWGSASKPCSAVGIGDGDYFSFMNRGDLRIFFDMSDISITITTDGARAAYSGFIVIEYIRDGS
jgi:hypothetical protein